ncbi:hypothetical protein CHS0354_017131 [Potamilus streckersoni]|uniref:Alpha/beta hydrolase fold-5 domain-containing protein n=1 Tax=Potamilus streckersoni TaxID=2493646 RepID=A0AAE0S3K6_9BIVA|nr:hypothetical protein CHS0354_017131 [Potamilus streckersoni]
MACPAMLWIALLEDFVFDIPNPLELELAVDKAFDELKNLGMKSNNYFLAGHSLGGVFVGMYGMSHPTQLKGILLYASYLTREHALHAYPVPVMTLSGDLDGLTRITRIVDTFESVNCIIYYQGIINLPRKLENDVKNDTSATFRTPVIVMPGVNHGQFASGLMPPNVAKHDLKPDVTEENAHEQISNYTRDFILATLPDPNPYAKQAMVSLSVSYQNTLAIIQPLLDIKGLDDNSNHTSVWTSMSQKIIAGSNLDKYVKAYDTEVSVAYIGEKNPEEYLNEEGVTVLTYSSLRQPINPEDVSEVPQTPEEIMAKMKSSQAIADLLGNVTASGNLTCKDVNQVAFAYVLANTSTAAKKRFKQRGLPIMFYPDKPIKFEEDWIRSKLQLDYNELGLHVTSYSHVTNVKNQDNGSPGMHFCKLLSPYRAMEWIYIDSLKINGTINTTQS